MAKDGSRPKIERIGIFEKPKESVTQLLSKAELAYVPDQFDYRKVGTFEYPQKVDLALVTLGYPISNDHTLQTIQKLGYKAAYLDQLLLVAIDNPDLQFEGYISAQGSRWAYRCNDSQCSSKYHCDHLSNSIDMHKATEVTTGYLGAGSIGDGIKRFLNFACPTSDFVWNEKTKFLIWNAV